MKISDYHPFLKNGCLIENKMHGASTQLRPVSHKCKLVGARVFPGRHVYGALTSCCVCLINAVEKVENISMMI